MLCMWCQVVYSTDCTFTVLSLAQNYTRFFLKLVSASLAVCTHLFDIRQTVCMPLHICIGAFAAPHTTRVHSHWEALCAVLSRH